MKQNIIIFIAVVFLSFGGCKKQDEFLNEKVNISQTVPTTLEDFQNLLNNEDAFNYLKDPSLGALTGEDYYVSNKNWNSAVVNARNAYIFASDIYEGSGSAADWSNPYKAVYITNVVLDGINNLKSSNSPDEVAKVKGQALFYRSWNFYNLLQTYSMTYDSLTATADLGIPLRLTSDFNIRVIRSSVKDCYTQILSDLQTCLDLLPQTSEVLTRPNKITVNAFLARIYLAIGNYQEAFKNADTVLENKHDLLDFNNVSTTAYPNLFTSFVPEDIYHSTLNAYNFLGAGYAFIDSTLYASYDINDLRKSVFFVMRPSGILTYRGSYDYRGAAYSGLATDEIYLIRAECLARLGNVNAAMDDLNRLLYYRWKQGTFVSYSASGSEEALGIILAERRKELINRGLRWTDLRRLNKESRFESTLTRSVNGLNYTLPPNDKRYAMPIPASEIKLMGLIQNER
ncbi:SusD family protein [bacterium A37T11]|nr:SusD family protein [bacterium A37T11]